MMKFRIPSLSLSRLSVIAILAVAAAACFVVVALAAVRTSASEAVAAWRTFADQASLEQRTFRSFITQAGAGGLVDDYERLIETGDETLAGAIYAHGGAALAALKAYPVSGDAPQQVQAKAALQTVIRDHLSRVGKIIALHRANRPAAEIERFGRISDPAAAAALATLADAVAATVPSRTGLAEPKALALLDFRRFLGVEGLLPYADAYLKTGDPATRAKAEASLAVSRAALERYGRHPISKDEGEALAQLNGELDVIGGQLARAWSAGLPPVDASRLEATLLQLEGKVYAEAVAAQNNLQTTLGRVSRQAGMIILLVGGGAVVIVAGSIWLLGFRIGRRIKAITRAMGGLAEGRLDIDIPAVGDHDEIGAMSRALLVFRDGLKANIALTKELADSSRLASLGAMVAGMAHELNTPLGNALAVSSSMEDECKALAADVGSGRILRSTLQGHAASLYEAASLIQRNLLRASEHIGSFKQVAVDQTSGQRREFALDGVLRNIVQTMTPQFKRTPYRLMLGECPAVAMDSYPGALSQVITNLVENGLTHGLSGRPHGRVLVEAKAVSPSETQIVVSDDGVGIAADVLPRIFRAFFTTRAGRGGSGLGLHIVKSIVSGPLGGQIAVDAQEGRGARFVVTIPNVAPSEAQIVSEPDQGERHEDAQAA